MENENAKTGVPMDAQTVDSIKSLLKTQDGDTTTMPSPPSSVKATESDNHRNEDGSLSANFEGSASVVSAQGEASTGNHKTTTVNGVGTDCHIS